MIHSQQCDVTNVGYTSDETGREMFTAVKYLSTRCGRTIMIFRDVETCFPLIQAYTLIRTKDVAGIYTGATREIKVETEFCCGGL